MRNERRRRSRATPARKVQEYAPVVIRDRAQLRSFAASRAFVSRQPLILTIPGMSPLEAFAAGERLNKDRGECGCSLGAQAMTAGFAIALASLTIRYGSLTPAMLMRLPIAIAATAIFAALGKIGGIAMARRRARRDVARILAALSD